MQVNIVGTEIDIIQDERKTMTMTAAEALELLRELDLEKERLSEIACEQLEEEMAGEPTVPTIDFEYDLSFYGGDYDQAGAITQIPVSLIEQFGEEEAFERFTGLDRCHIIHYDCEESVEYGNEVVQAQLDEAQKHFQTLAGQHYPTCEVCREKQQGE